MINNERINLNETTEIKKEEENRKKENDLMALESYIKTRRYIKAINDIKCLEKNPNLNLDDYINYIYIKIHCLHEYILENINKYSFQNGQVVYNEKTKVSEHLEIVIKEVLNSLYKFEEKIKEFKQNDNYHFNNVQKEKITVIYTKCFYIEGKYAYLKNNYFDSSGFYILGIQLIEKNINNFISSETFYLFSKLLLNLSNILIQDESYDFAKTALLESLSFLNKNLLQLINKSFEFDKNDDFKDTQIFKILKATILNMLLLSINLEYQKNYVNALSCYKICYWLTKKFYGEFDPIFMNIVTELQSKSIINLFKNKKEKEVEIQNKVIQLKKQKHEQQIIFKKKLKSNYLLNSYKSLHNKINDEHLKVFKCFLQYKTNKMYSLEEYVNFCDINNNDNNNEISTSIEKKNTKINLKKNIKLKTINSDINKNHQNRYFNFNTRNNYNNKNLFLYKSLASNDNKKNKEYSKKIDLLKNIENEEILFQKESLSKKKSKELYKLNVSNEFNKIKKDCLEKVKNIRLNTEYISNRKSNKYFNHINVNYMNQIEKMAFKEKQYEHQLITGLNPNVINLMKKLKVKMKEIKEKEALKVFINVSAKDKKDRENREIERKNKIEKEIRNCNKNNFFYIDKLSENINKYNIIQYKI